jgi:hypothetical protein
VKLATFLLAPLVAVLLFMLPVPAAAAPLPAVEQSDPADEAPATPTPAVEQAGAIVDLHATAGRLRGRVELGWSIAPPAEETAEAVDLAGSVFVVERSTNGSSWRPVKACYLPWEGETATYACTDMRLASGTTYAYRVCLAARPTTCSNALTTEAVAVKAP